jgi:hypothetical protein
LLKVDPSVDQRVSNVLTARSTHRQREQFIPLILLCCHEPVRFMLVLRPGAERRPQVARSCDGTAFNRGFTSGVTSMNRSFVAASLLLTFASTSAYAIFAIPVPEPGMLELLAVGALAMIIAGIRKRHKK